MKGPACIVPWTHAVEMEHKHVFPHPDHVRLFARAERALRIVSLSCRPRHPHSPLPHQNLPHLIAADSAEISVMP